MNATQVPVCPLRTSDQLPCLGKWRKMTSDMTTDQQESRRGPQRSGGGSSQSESSLKMQRHDSAGSLPTSFTKKTNGVDLRWIFGSLTTQWVYNTTRGVAGVFSYFKLQNNHKKSNEQTRLASY